MTELVQETSREELVPDVPGASTTSVTTTENVSQRTTRASWLASHLRNIIAIALTSVVCYLALMGEQTAQAAVIAAFSVLAGAIWGERAALKRPGQDS